MVPVDSWIGVWYYADRNRDLSNETQTEMPCIGALHQARQRTRWHCQIVPGFICIHLPSPTSYTKKSLNHNAMYLKLIAQTISQFVTPSYYIISKLYFTQKRHNMRSLDWSDICTNLYNRTQTFICFSTRLEWGTRNFYSSLNPSIESLVILQGSQSYTCIPQKTVLQTDFATLSMQKPEYVPPGCYAGVC